MLILSCTGSSMKYTDFFCTFTVLSDSRADGFLLSAPVTDPLLRIFRKDFAGVLELVDKSDLGSDASAYGFESLHPHCFF